MEVDVVELGVVVVVDVAGVLVTELVLAELVDPRFEDITALEADTCASRYESGTNGLPDSKGVTVSLQQSPAPRSVLSPMPQQNESVPPVPQGKTVL